MAEISLSDQLQEEEDIPISISEYLPKRKSDPGKQFIAGLSDIATGIPVVAGVVGAGIETLVSYPFNDKGFGETFAKSMSEGIDASLVEAGFTGREFVNDLLGIDEPVFTEDQLARLGGVLIPIPGIQLASGAGKLAKGANLALNLTTPVVKRTRLTKTPYADKLTGQFGTGGTVFDKAGFGKRAAAQAGIGIGIEQGMRALVDRPELPLIFSEEALTGGVSTEEDLIDVIGDRASDDIMAGTDEPISLSEYTSIDIPQGEISLSEYTEPKEVSLSDHVDLYKELDAKVERQDNWNTTLLAGAAILAGVGGVAAQRILAKKSLIKAAELSTATVKPDDTILTLKDKLGLTPTAADKFFDSPVSTLAAIEPSEIPGVLHKGALNAKSYIKEQYIDSSQALADTLRKVGAGEETVNNVVTNSHTDIAGMSARTATTGEFPNSKSSIVTVPLREIENDFRALDEVAQQAFDDVTLAQTELATRNIGREGTGLFRSRFGINKTKTDLTKLIDAGRANPQVKALLDKTQRFFDDHLAYQVDRGTWTKQDVDKLKELFTLPDGTRAYMPLHNFTTKTFSDKLKRMFGIGSSKSEEINLIGEFEFRNGHTIGNDGKPLLRPIEAMKLYNYHSIEHANRSALHWQALGELAGVRLDPSTGLMKHIKLVDGHAKPIASESEQVLGRDTRYIGSGSLDNVNDTGRLVIEGDIFNSKVKDRFFKGTDAPSLNDIKASVPPNEIMTVHHQGRMHVFHVPDASIRAALQTAPELGPGLFFLNHWKKIFTSFTTGQYSPFAFISFMFSTQQTALNTMARRGLVEGLKSAGDSAKGVVRLLEHGGSMEIANYLEQSLAKNAKFGQFIPEATRIKLRDRMNTVIQNSIVGQIQGSSGRLTAGLSANEFTGSIPDFKDLYGVNFANQFGAAEAHLVGRMWKTLNTALHEGPAFGAINKRMGELLLENGGKPLTQQQMRNAVDWGKTVAGDVRRMGASKAAKAFNAAIPFSGAMIQSWNSIGSAALQDFPRFMLGVGTLIGVPTVTEMAFNALLSETGETFQDPVNPNKQWTYNDYYWNGFTTQQRADNMIMMVPGKPPWEAAVFPISPEFGLFRGIVMESLDAIYNFSNVGNIAMADQGTGKINRSQFLASVARVLDVPAPPVVGAAFAAAGVDLRVGPSLEETDEGTTISIARALPLGQGERVTRNLGRNKHANGALDQNTAAVIREIFGAGGSVMVAMADAFHAGTYNEVVAGPQAGMEGNIFEGGKEALAALGDGLHRQARWTNPLFGKVLRPNANDEIAQQLVQRRQNLLALKKDYNALFNGALDASFGGLMPGNTVVPPDDPVAITLAADAADLEQQINGLDAEISEMRRAINKYSLATNVDRQERDDLVDALQLQIQQLKAIQLGSLVDYEEKASIMLSERFERDVDVNLRTFKPRSNLTGSSAFQELRK